VGVAASGGGSNLFDEVHVGIGSVQQGRGRLGGEFVADSGSDLFLEGPKVSGSVAELGYLMFNGGDVVFGSGREQLV